MADKYVTAKVSEILPNPHRSSIGGGTLHPDKIEALKASIQKNGVWDGWPVRRNAQGNLEMVGSTHRLKATRDLFGGSHTLRFQLVDYDDAQMLRGMIDENLAGAESKSLPVREQADYVVTTKSYIISNPSACTLKGKHEHGDVDCLLQFLGESWTAVRLNTLLSMELLAPELGKTADLKPAAVARMVQFPISSQMEIAKTAGEDLGKRTLKTLLDSTKEERNAYNQASGKAKDKAEKKLLKKVSQLATIAKGKKSPIGLETVKVSFAKHMTKEQLCVCFISLLDYPVIHAAWKQQAAILHPDNKVTGDSKKASNLNELWGDIKKRIYARGDVRS
jgi:hypothetical protein